MRNAFSIAADLFGESVAPKSRWYCNRPYCDGKPHDQWPHEHARTAQCPPAEFTHGAALVWLILAGRGFGKTRTGAEWLGHQARTNPKTEWGIVAPTYKDLKEVCVEGESGLLNALEGTLYDYNKSSLQIVLRASQTVIRSYSAETPERVRGPNLSGAWLDEIAQNQGSYPAAWKNLSMAIRRKGSPVKVVATSTPAPVPLVRQFTDRTDNSVVITRGSTFDNRDNLADSFIAEMEVRYKGTRFERQELFGELLTDVPGALWTPDLIESARGVLL